MDSYTEAKQDYERIQGEKVARGGQDFRFPIAAELADRNWEKDDITVGELMNCGDLQLYVGNPGEFSYDIWHQTGTSQAAEVARHWDTIKKYLPAEQRTRIDNISTELATLVLSRQERGQDYPLFILKNQLLLPYTTGHVIDGNNRLLSLLYSLRQGEIQESATVPIWRSTIPATLTIPYNVATFCFDKKTIGERIALLKDRSNKPQLV